MRSQEARKAESWGGHGFSAAMSGIGLMLGLLGRVAAAFGIACVMEVAIAKVHAVNGFFMNWGGRQKGEGFEFHLLVPAMTAARR